MLKWFSIGLLIALCSGCSHHAKTLPRTATFFEAQYAPYDRPGTGVIEGQAFVKSRAGDVKLAAGNEVILNPVTSYSSEWYRVSLEGNNLEPGDQRAVRFTRTTIADAGGNFRFANLPAGSYYIITGIFWEVPSAYGTFDVTGSRIGATCEVREGQTTKVIVTH